MQAADYCEQALLHYTQPCRSGPSGTDTTSLPPPAALFPCTPPHSEAVLSVSGNLTPYTAAPPAAGFECSCICNTAALSRLGTVAVALRAADRGPNFQALESQCAAAVPLQLLAGVLQRPCSSATRAGVPVRAACGQCFVHTVPELLHPGAHSATGHARCGASETPHIRMCS